MGGAAADFTLWSTVGLEPGRVRLFRTCLNEFLVKPGLTMAEEEKIKLIGLRVLAMFVALTSGLGNAALAQGRIQLPNFGDASAAVVSSSEEKRLGEAFLREIRASADMLDDPEIDAYVGALGYRLAAASNTPSQDFTFFTVFDPAINAFAGPGGVIGINSGLLLAVETESELAAVLGHEIAHVTQKHIARAYEFSDRYSIPAMAGLLAALVLGTQNPQAGSAAAAAVLGGQLQSQIDFIRANEHEADRVGIETLARAGYDPNAMAVFFERLQESARYYQRPPEFLSTHPVSSSRIADSRARAARTPYRQYEDEPAFHRVRAKLEVLERGPKKAIEVFNQRIADGSGPAPEANVYGRALAQIALRRFGEAQTELQALVKRYPGVLPFQDALARALRGRGKVTAAVAIYTEALKLYLHERQMTVGLAETWIDAGHPARASALLSAYLRNQPADAASFRLLALSYERAGKLTASRAALAEHHYLNGRLDQAVYQLEQAERNRTDDYFLSAKLAARLKQLRRERAERDQG
jgi:beta-barrel assembly-enhancing protease